MHDFSKPKKVAITHINSKGHHAVTEAAIKLSAGMRQLIESGLISGR